jgi:heparinase II/III-like protein
LHFDLWWRGQNIACDPGTYLYNGDPPWTNALAGSAVHNTVTIDGSDQMKRAGRFLWLDWAQATSETYPVGTMAQAMEGTHDGYARIGATHRRSVLCIPDDDVWVVVDDVTGSYSGDVRLHWLFPDVPFEFDPQNVQLQLHFSEGDFTCLIKTDIRCSASLAKAGQIVSGTDEDLLTMATRGWRSLYYGSKVPALSLAVKVAAKLAVRFVTCLAPAQVSIKHLSPAAVKYQFAQEICGIALHKTGAPKIFQIVEG